MKFLVLSIILVLSLFAGELKLQSGSVMGLTSVLGDSKIDPKNDNLLTNLSIDGDDITTLKGTISVEMALFKSQNADRDENMLETLEVEKFTKSIYTIQSVEDTKAPSVYILKGELDLHGVKKALDFNATITQDDMILSIDAKSKINVEDYGIEMPCLLGFTMCVDENVEINGVAVFNK
ncbi:YceI family protein [Sulfurimonas lithotrophica]|uniref:YceI family protein n=1 Tax=Sulfurimonas lithotrophica TaxID=2590022 RepID=A0A5P8NXY5_9BACT|nr:YceI family protein [Sulfurimonas lithotrophica]QFR48274.1 YceI family protein [Sulfurimonas lithotrophica]